jgi:hypothetical protein
MVSLFGAAVCDEPVANILNADATLFQQFCDRFSKCRDMRVQIF